MQPSPQQQRIYDWVTGGRGSAVVEAVAGAGKTTTLVGVCKLIRGSGVFTAYNRAIADEIGERLRAAGVNGRDVRSATFHSLGFGAVRRAFPDVRVDADKVRRIAEGGEYCGAQHPAVPEPFRPFVVKAVSLAKQRAIGFLCDFSEGWREMIAHFDLDEELTGEGWDDADAQELARRVREGVSHAQRTLQASVSLDRSVVDYDDMVYAPLVHGLRMWQNDWVLVDEAQDTNPARRALARKMLKPGGRAVFVGDSRQAIYGFTGADNDALDVIAREFNCVRLPLTVTYRCPRAVVEHARNWVSHIEAHESAPLGSVTTLREDAFRGLPAEDLGGESAAVLCRNTKPLVELAFELIRRRVPCHVEGKDIGAGLLALARRWKTARTVAELRDRLEDYRAKQVERLMAKGQERRAEQIADRVDTLLVVLGSLHDEDGTDEVARVVKSMFADSGERPRGLTLSTVHKAKGREWPTVWLLGRNLYMPSPYARQDWQCAQEDNLVYVAVTRAKERLVEVEVERKKC